MFVRIQLFMMPGEERKFSRRRMVACIPICRRAREIAAQATGSDGISTIGVGRVSVTGGMTGDDVGVRVGVLVSVGDIVGDGVPVPVTDAGTGVSDGISVEAGEVEETVTITGVGGSGVNVVAGGTGDGGVSPKIKNRKMTNRMIAMINLKRS